MRRLLYTVILAVSAITFTMSCAPGPDSSGAYNVRRYGAKGDGRAIDSPAINKAISAASAAGGGTVVLPQGVYSCYSIRLASHVTLELQKGAVIKAAQYGAKGGFDPAEPNDFTLYQDFGHSHWKNSMIWGIDLEDVRICGEGLIDGRLISDGITDRESETGIETDFTLKKGVANKAIGLRDCRNVTIEGITIFRGGHFCILATGVDSLTIKNVTADSNRDGFDIDCCRGVVVSGCTVNTPWDDAIVLKSTYALGQYRACENVTIKDCSISGYEIGSVLDGTLRQPESNVFHNIETRSSGRVKIGTESSGDFRNVRVSNSCLENCGGLHVETTDGGNIENISFSDITIRDCCDSPIFVMIGSRLRSPEGCTVGSIRGVSFCNINSIGARPDYGVIVSGYKDHFISDIAFEDVRLNSRGGLAPEHPAREIPEILRQYPDPKSFGTMPSSGFFFRHVDGISFRKVELTFDTPDTRPEYIFEDCKNYLTK